MTKLELVKQAIDFAMFDLCDGYLDMPNGCEGCPLWNEDAMDEHGNVNCRETMLKKFIGEHKDMLDSTKNISIRHGKWEAGNPICPICGENKFKDLDADIWADWMPKHCPNCGSSMTKDEAK